MDLTINQVNRSEAGVFFVPDTAAAGETHTFTNTGREVLLCNNGQATTEYLTVTTQSTVDGSDVEDKSLPILAGYDAAFGPWPLNIYNNASAKVELTVSAEMSLSVLRI